MIEGFLVFFRGAVHLPGFVKHVFEGFKHPVVEDIRHIGNIARLREDRLEHPDLPVLIGDQGEKA